MPTVLQASISRVPAGAVTFFPSTVMFTFGYFSHNFELDCGCQLKTGRI